MRKVILTLLVVLAFVLNATAQTRTVTGKVTDEKGVPLAGVSVTTTDLKSGTKTDAQGNYSISVDEKTKNLVFSSINFETRTASAKAGATVSLVSSEKKLEEIVVVGYGTKSTREVTGSISKVAGAKIAGEPVASFEQALAGKTAGVQISLGSGVLADRTAIRVRGINSISSSSQPLVVIDGIPQIPVTNLNAFNTGNGTRFDPLALLNANDIESIEVLKDAGAAAIYGSRGSNGIILVTTKKGRKGAIRVSVDSKTSFSSAAKLPPLLNGDDFIAIQNEKGANRFGASSAYATMAKNSDVNGDGVNDRTNWNDYAYQSHAMTYDNAVSISGGAENLSVYGSVRYLKQQGITAGNGLQSGQARLNLDVTPKKWFKAGIQLAYTKTLNIGVLTDGFIAGTTVTGWQSVPTVSPFSPAGQFGYNLTSAGLLGLGNNTTVVGGVNFLPSASYYPNIAANTKLNRNNNTAEQVNATVYGEIQFVKGLKLTSKFGVQNLSNFEDQYSSPFVSGNGFTYNGLVQEQRQDYKSWVWQNYLNYDHVFASKHKVGFTAGTEYQRRNFNSQYTGAGNFTDPFFQNVIGGTYTNTQPGSTTVLDFTDGNISSNGLISYFGRVNYTFNNKYYVEGAVRSDGFSAFAKGKEFGTFKSVTLGWELTKESFLSNSRWLNFLKIRGSYGDVGNSNGIADYASKTLYRGAGYTSLNGLGITQAGNASLKWEKAKKTNVGVEAAVWKNRISVVADYFENDINDLILSAPTLYTVGIPNSSILYNIGGMTNKGTEFTLNITPVSTKDFTWTSSFNYTHIKNKVTGLVPANKNADIQGTYNVASVGKALGTYYMPKWAGVDAATGNPQWYAADGSIKRYNFGATGSALWTNEKGTPVAALAGSDYQYINKGGLPTFYGGWENNFTYKNFDLSIVANYQGGNYIYNASKSGMLTNQFSNNFTDILRRWQKPGDVTDIPRLWLNDQTANQVSTRFLEKGDFIRVRTITFGFSATKDIIEKIGFTNARFYVTVFNPFVITNYSGLDPDVNTSGTTQSNIALGIDSRGTPQPRTMTLGVNFTF